MSHYKKNKTGHYKKGKEQHKQDTIKTTNILIKNLENRMIDTAQKKGCPKVQAIKENMRQRTLEIKPFRISIFDYRAKRYLDEMRFYSQIDAMAYLNRKCYKKDNRYFHKAPFGKLNMELEFTYKGKL